MRRLLPLLLGLFLFMETTAQPPTCQLRLYETYQDYQQDSYTCWEIVSFRSFFNGQLRLKAKGPNGVEKIIKENYWGCYLEYDGADGLQIRQLFRFSFETGAPMAYQESQDDFAVFYQLVGNRGRLVQLISRSLRPTNRIDEFEGPDADGIRIILGRDANGQKTSQAYRKKMQAIIKAIPPSPEILKLQALAELE
jgi:hypothetical protein